MSRILQAIGAIGRVGTLGLLLAAGPALGGAAPDTPIIAELLTTPERFADRDVAVYGIVVEVSDDGRAFLLQDVSQRPLRVLRRQARAVGVGDQVLVRGRFHVAGTHLAAASIDAVGVTAGGGCC